MTSMATELNTHPTAPLPDRRTPEIQETHQLISLFLPDYLRLAEPDAAAQMVLETCTILPTAEDDEINLIRAQVTSSRGEGVTVIVAIEPEALPPQQMAQKLARILFQSELTYGLPVLLSVLYLSGGRPGLRLESARIDSVGEIECVRVFFTVWGLAESRADHYISLPEPLAWAMAPYMRSISRTQQELSEAVRARIDGAQLSDDLRAALLRFLPDLQRELNVA